MQHEALHAYDQLYLNARDDIRADVMSLMDPEPEIWHGGKTWAKFPFECYAVYGSAALFNIAKPVYANLLSRKIAVSNFPDLRDLLLS